MTDAFVVCGDCRDVLKTFPAESISAVVTDPPYGLGRTPDMDEVLRHWLAGGDYAARGGGFMGKAWDSFVPGPSVWREVIRVLKPGGHVLSFSGTRTYDLSVLAMRLAGFEIRDQLAWLYAQGFPKSKNVAAAIDKKEGVIGHRSVSAVTASVFDGSGGRPPDRSVGPYVPPPDSPGAPWAGWGIALKPAHEPIVLARKPLVGTVASNVRRHGTGGINIDGCRLPMSDEDRQKIDARKAFNAAPGVALVGSVNGSLRPTCSAAHKLGRWPANVILDEGAGEILDEQAPPQYGNPSRFFYCPKTSTGEREAGLDHLPKRGAGELTDRADGSAGLNSPRAEAGRKTKGRANLHPTVKPIALMRWLIRLITPPGGVVLDPFAGSGSTLCAAIAEGVASVGIELTEEYIPLIEGRIAEARRSI